MSDQPEALRLADQLKARYGNTVTTSQAAAELRRQHSEIEALKAERDAYKAAIDQFNHSCDSICAAREMKGHCEPYLSRKLTCPNCTKDDRIEVDAARSKA